MGKTKKKQEIDNRYEISLVDFITNPNLELSIKEKVKLLDNLMAKNVRFSNVKKIADSNLEECEEFKQLEKSDENLILEDTDLRKDYDIADEIIETASRKGLMYYKYAIEKESQEANPIIVQKDDEGYVDFFTYKIKTLKAQDGYDDFLSYHREKFVQEDINKYINTLRIAIKILNKDEKYSSYTFLIEDFVSNLSGKKNDDFFKIKRKYKGSRDPEDSLTTLNSEETAYFFYELYKHKVIFNDSSCLDRESLYQAIELLTGFSSNKIRQNFRTAEKKEVSEHTVKKVKKRISSFFEID